VALEKWLWTSGRYGAILNISKASEPGTSSGEASAMENYYARANPLGFVPAQNVR
jgi:hypothetical protein